MEKNEYLAKMQEQMIARKALLDLGRIRIRISETPEPRARQKGEAEDKQEKLPPRAGKIQPR